MSSKEKAFNPTDHLITGGESEEFYSAVNALKSLLEVEDIHSVEKAFALATAQKYQEDFLERKKVSMVPMSEYHSYAKKFFKNYDIEKAYTQSPPGSEHMYLFRKNNKPTIFLSQPYQIKLSVIKKMIEYSEENNLEFSISNKASFWYPSQALSVEFTKV